MRVSGAIGAHQNASGLFATLVDESQVEGTLENDVNLGFRRRSLHAEHQQITDGEKLLAAFDGLAHIQH
jgi:hypothetical protein